jgi:tripartite-type tricarboxylate transporter receptor subunit TctC
MTAQDLMNNVLIAGGTGVANDTVLTPKVINAVIGTKLKVVSGYPGMSDIMFAMERGEVAAVTDQSWSNVKRNPGLLQEKLVRVLMQFDIERSVDLPDVPLAQDFAKNAADKSLLSLYFAQKAVARPVALPPEVPVERIAVMRAAFMKMAQDPEAIAEAEKSGIAFDATDHRSVEKVIDIVESASPDVIEQLRTIMASK